MADSFTITRTFAAPQEVVWDAWTKPQHFSMWFGGGQVVVPLETLKFHAKVGADWYATMLLPDGNQIAWVGEFVAVDRASHLAFTMTDSAADAARATITVDLTAVGDSTQVVMTQSGMDFTDEQVEATKAGYGQFFDTMDDLLATLTA